MLRHLFAVISFCLAITGCATGTERLDELKDRSDADVATYTVNMNYQDAYRKILESGLVPGVEGKSALYTELKVAKVWIQPPIYFNNYFALIEIQPEAANKARMNYYCLTPGFKSFCHKVQALFPDAEKIEAKR